MHPCSNCHQWVVSNPQPRKLNNPHNNFELQHGLHGKGGFWCFTCHDVKNNGSVEDTGRRNGRLQPRLRRVWPVPYQQARDWANGAHGKRVGNWQGKRQVLNCTACHYQHRPTIKPREPLPGPVMRVGLPRPDTGSPPVSGPVMATNTEVTGSVTPTDDASPLRDQHIPVPRQPTTRKRAMANLTTTKATTSAARAATFPQGPGGHRRAAGAVTATGGAWGGNTLSDAFADFFQQHYQRMTADEIATTIERIERKAKRRYGVDIDLQQHTAAGRRGVRLRDQYRNAAATGTVSTPALKENNLSRDTQYIRVVEMDRRQHRPAPRRSLLRLSKVPDARQGLPAGMQCMQCDNPALRQGLSGRGDLDEPDGIVVVDYDWCIGCRYCMAACPYQARHFNWGNPEISTDELNQDTHYLGNRPSPARRGGEMPLLRAAVPRNRQPACQEACPTGAGCSATCSIPNSEIRYVLENKAGVPSEGGPRHRTQVLVLPRCLSPMTPTKTCRASCSRIGQLFQGSGVLAVGRIVAGVDRLGGWHYWLQLRDGLIVTNMTNQVSWGFYIANFTFLVGVAAAAVMLVVPAYIFHRATSRTWCLMGDTMAIAAVTMAILFVSSISAARTVSGT